MGEWEGVACRYVSKPRSFCDVLKRSWQRYSGLNADGLTGPLNIGPIHSEGYDTAHISACASTAGVIAQYWAVASNSHGCHLTYERWEQNGKCKGNNNGSCIVPCFSKGNPHFLATCHVPEKSDQTRVRLFFVGCNGKLCEARRENEHWGWGGKECGNIKWEKCWLLSCFVPLTGDWKTLYIAVNSSNSKASRGSC